LTLAVLDDWHTAPVDARVRATLGLLEKVTLDPAGVRPDDTNAVRAAGVSDAGISEALHVSFAFNLITRLADAFGWHVPAPEDFERDARFLLRRGYRLIRPISRRALASS
jgi:alkylhydroperoxidase family enzyme